MTREEFAAAVTKMRGAGRVRLADWQGDHKRRPYRFAALDVDCPRAEAAERVATLAPLAVEVGAYLTMHVHRDSVSISLQLSRDLADDEVGEDYFRPATVELSDEAQP